jgi:hypothetical protein
VDIHFWPHAIYVVFFTIQNGELFDKDMVYQKSLVVIVL